jgi:hypothetical protein
MPVPSTVSIGGEPRVGEPVRVPGRAREIGKGALAGHRQHDVAVTGLDGPEHGPAGRRKGELGPLDLGKRHRQHAFQHRHVDELPTSRVSPLVKRGEEGAEGVGAAQNVGDEDAVVIRLGAAILVRQVCHVVPARRVHDRGVGRAAGRRTALAVARDGAVDQRRLHGGEGGIVQAQPLHDPWAEVLHQHVARPHQPLDDVDRRRALQVEHDALLAGIELAEITADPLTQRRARAHQVAFGRLDLDHGGPEIGEEPRTVGAGDGGGQVEDAQIVQDLVGHGPYRYHTGSNGSSSTFAAAGADREGRADHRRGS